MCLCIDNLTFIRTSAYRRYGCYWRYGWRSKLDYHTCVLRDLTIFTRGGGEGLLEDAA